MCIKLCEDSIMQKLSEKALKNKQEYTKKFRRDNYKKITLELPNSIYDELKNESQRRGESVAGYIKESIKDRLEKTKSLPDTPADTSK